MTIPHSARVALALAFLVSATAASSNPHSGGGAGFAATGAGEAARSRLVSYSDLDLRLASDRSVLDRRVAAAIGSLCSATVSTVWFFQKRWERECRADALADARPQIDSAISRSETAARAETYSAAIRVRRRV